MNEPTGQPAPPKTARTPLESAEIHGEAFPRIELSVANVADVLRVLLGLPASWDDGARPEPYTVDARAWAEWCLAGLEVCHVPEDASEPWAPNLKAAREAGVGFALVVLQSRHPTITHGAAAGETSRRAFREALKRHGLYAATDSTEATDTIPVPEITPQFLLLLRRLAEMTPEPEAGSWETAANAALHRIRRTARGPSERHAEQILRGLEEGMSEAVIPTALSVPVRASVDDGRVTITVGNDRIDAGRLDSSKAARTLTLALARHGGPAVE